MNLPLISIITPYTNSRKHFLPALQQMVYTQTYCNIEWLTNDNEHDSLGKKANEMVERATGDIIVQFDSDDYYSSNFIMDCYNFLNTYKLDITGYNTAYFLNHDKKEAFLFNNNNNQYVFGSGMMFKKSYWKQYGFNDITRAVDAHFVKLCEKDKIKPHNYITNFYATLHNNNSTNTYLNPSLYTEQNYNNVFNLFK